MLNKYLAALGIASAVAAPVPHGTIRQITLGENQVAMIHTAVGFSTLVEFPGKPTSVVVGDQDSFKVEYIGSAIAIKPLASRARTDLFAFTEFGRFNCALLVGPADSADLLVRIAPPPPPEDAPKRVPIRKSINRLGRYRGFTAKVAATTPISIHASQDARVEIEFELRTTTQDYFFGPTAIGIKQGQRFLNIESVYVDSLRLSPQTGPIQGRVTIGRSDLLSNAPMSFVFAVPGGKRETIHRIFIPIGQPVEQEKRRSPFAVPKDKNVAG